MMLWAIDDRAGSQQCCNFLQRQGRVSMNVYSRNTLFEIPCRTNHCWVNGPRSQRLLDVTISSDISLDMHVANICVSLKIYEMMHCNDRDMEHILSVIVYTPSQKSGPWPPSRDRLCFILDQEQLCLSALSFRRFVDIRRPTSVM